MVEYRLIDFDLENIVCPYCGQVAVLMNGRELYGDNSTCDDQNFWVCSDCDAHVGCHKRNLEHGIDGNEPLGRLANKRLRMARIKVHMMFDPLWEVAGWDRTHAYHWLAKRLGISVESCHVANFSLKMCARAIRVLEGIRPLLNLKDKNGSVGNRSSVKKW